MKRDLLTIWDLTADEIHALLNRARQMKADWAAGRLAPVLNRKVLGMIFVKPSTRTRVSFEAAMYRLGGQAIFMTSQDSQISRHEPLSDTARVLSRYVDALAVRTFAHEDVEQLGRHASIPVINGLTDLYHPCQVLSDLLTISERRGSLEGLRVAWLGDGNNVAHSWVVAACRLGFELVLACPTGYEPAAKVLERAWAEGAGGIEVTTDPAVAMAAADVVYTDVWASMGQEQEAEERRKIFQPYQLNNQLLAKAPPEALVMHCLPAHRGEEISAEALEGPQSVVIDQAENRMHLQMALLEWVLSSSGSENS